MVATLQHLDHGLHCKSGCTSDKMCNDSSDSMEEKTNDTSVVNDTFGNTTEIFNQGDADGWQWDSTSVWLVILTVLLILLMLVNILFFIKCARSLKRSLCNAFIDLIFLASGMILSFGARQPSTAAVRDSQMSYKASSTSMEPIDGFRRTPLCCFRDRAHNEFETAIGGYDNQVDLTTEDENKGGVVVELHLKLNNKSPVMGIEEERQNAEEKGVLGEERYLENLNANKEAEKVFKKLGLTPPTVLEKRMASVEQGKLQSEDPSNTTAPTYASVVKLPRKSTNGDAAAPDPEIYI